MRDLEEPKERVSSDPFAVRQGAASRVRGLGLRAQILLALVAALALSVTLVAIAIDRLASRALVGTGVISGAGDASAGTPGLVGMRGLPLTMLAGGGSVLQRSGARLWKPGTKLGRGLSTG